MYVDLNKMLTRGQPFFPAPRAKEQALGLRSRLGVRKFLRNQLHLFVFTLIHFFFSVYIRFRQAWHGIKYRVRSVIYYHHRTPEIIARDVKDLTRIPKHLSVILKLGENAKNGAELERLVSEVSDIAAWCASAGIPRLSVYEKTGMIDYYKL
jgi:hypothetical protein